MPRRTFASQKELQDYAGQTGKVCRLEVLPSVSGCSRRINTRSSVYARRVSSEAGHTHPEGGLWRAFLRGSDSIKGLASYAPHCL